VVIGPYRVSANSVAHREQTPEHFDISWLQRVDNRVRVGDDRDINKRLVMRRIWVDGEENGRVRGDDPGLLLGLTVFETLRTYNGTPFRLQQHLDRLVGSANQLNITIPEKAVLTAEIQAVLEHTADADYRLRYTVTAGGHRIVDIQPIDTARIGAPIRVGRLAWDPPEWLPGVVKHGSRASWIVAAQQQGVDEVFLVDGAGYILEANRSNVFAVQDGVLCTPPLDDRFLEGVTRGALLEAAGEAGIPVEERPLHVDTPFDELYLSSTLKELAPVSGWGPRGGPMDGPLGLKLHQAFQEFVAREVSRARG